MCFFVPADLDPVAAVSQHVLHSLIGFHQLALLVDDNAGQCPRLADFAGVRLELSGEQLEQRRLAGAVRSDDADAVATLHTQREVANDRTLSETFRHILRVYDDLRPNVVLRECEFRSSRGPEHRSALGTHLVQFRKPSLVAPPARGHSALKPVQLELELCIELFRCARFLVVDPLGPRIEAAEANLGAPELSPIEPDAAPREPREKRPVVTDRDEGAGEPLQPVLQPLDRAEVEMVRRLVEQQHVGLSRERARDGRPPTFAAACGCNRSRQVDPDLIRDRCSLVRLWPVCPVQHPGFERIKARHIRILLKEDDVRARHDGALALVGIDHVRKTLEQSRLPRAVAADQRQAVALADIEIEAAEQPAFALDEPKAFISEDRRRHAGALTNHRRKGEVWPISNSL